MLSLHLSIENNLIQALLSEIRDLVQLLVVEAEVSHQGNLVPDRVVTLRTLVGRGAGEQGGEVIGIM